MSKSGPTRYRVPAALFLHHVQGHDLSQGSPPRSLVMRLTAIDL